MTPDQAAWVRQHVWPPIWRSNYEHIPGAFLDCACTKPPSEECQRGEHGDCRMRERGTAAEGVIQTSRLSPASFAEPYAHPSQAVSSTRNALAWVWPGGRPCRWVCACACHTRPGPQPDPAVEEPLDAQDRGLLFDLEPS